MMAAVLACRNQSSRLYAKPLQNLDVKNNIKILDFIVAQLSRCAEIEAIVLAISEKEENGVYKRLAVENGLPYIVGDDRDVLSRLIKGGELVGAEHVFRITTESPFTYIDNIAGVYAHQQAENIDYSYTEGLPHGVFFEIISLSALRRSWDEGESRHRSELCSSYICENKDEFRIAVHEAPVNLRRQDIRLTVDWPEDLIVVRKLFEDLGLSPDCPVSLENIIAYLDKHPEVNQINSEMAGEGRIWF